MSRLEMRGISKAFSGVTVLNGVDLRVEGGRVVALLGENGAGKSTLMKILTGVYQADAGAIYLDDHPTAIPNVQASRAIGIEMIHQELNLFSNLSVAENFLIGNENAFQTLGVVNYRDLHHRVEEILRLLNLKRDPGEPLNALGVGERQLVEIGKALQNEVRFLIMDEPTSALTQTETERLFELIRHLKSRGVGIIYISHRLEELFHIADEVTVLRDGRFVATRPMTDTNDDELVSLMVGRDIVDRYPRVPARQGEVMLACRKLSTERVHDVTLEVRAGEIVGLGGLMGAGRTELALALAGVDRVSSGHLEVRGESVRFRRPTDALRFGVVLVTEDRKEQGLILPFSVRENIALPTLEKRIRKGLVHSRSERDFASRLIDKLRVKTADMESPVESLSGGNQQKVVIGKWLGKDPDILLLDEPTRGVDVGAKQEIYQLMNQLKADGKAVLMISSDLPELLGMSDRVYVMFEGCIQGELTGSNMQEEMFMKLATGGVRNE